MQKDARTRAPRLAPTAALPFLARAHVAAALAAGDAEAAGASPATSLALALAVLLLIAWCAVRRAFDECARAQRTALTEGEQVRQLLLRRAAG